jgi:hypothetical protein
VFENRVLRRIFGPKRMKQEECGENCITRRFMIFENIISGPIILRHWYHFHCMSLCVHLVFTDCDKV